MRSKKFGVMNELFIPPDLTIFQQPRPAMDIYDTRLRYRSADLKIKGYVGEVYSEMPKHLHDLILKHSAFSETVSRYSLKFLLDLTLESVSSSSESKQKPHHLPTAQSCTDHMAGCFSSGRNQ
jgi:hypothetical protein